jgi:hypothetical protein
VHVGQIDLRQRDGIPRRDTRIHNLELEPPNDPKDNELRQSGHSVSHHLPTDTCQNDPELAALVNARPKLPEALKVGILAMITASI